MELFAEAHQAEASRRTDVKYYSLYNSSLHFLCFPARLSILLYTFLRYFFTVDSNISTCYNVKKILSTTT